jgi:N-acetylglucosaminyldiphosphoundecaprenol N-acetyl-beta-D-mannosaminyltransferase
LSPDFVWVGLGTPKQYRWVKRNKHLLRRGVILTVGFAFDVNAGTKPDAPLWMQRMGLTWIFRLFSEPRRLIGRYLRYNTLFVCYLFFDAVSRTLRDLRKK